MLSHWGIIWRFDRIRSGDRRVETVKSDQQSNSHGGGGGVFSSLTHHAGTFRLSQFLWYEVSRLEQTGLPITPSFSIYDPHQDSQCPSTCLLSEPNNLAFSDDTHHNITHTPPHKHPLLSPYQHVISCTFRSAVIRQGKTQPDRMPLLVLIQMHLQMQ